MNNSNIVFSAITCGVLEERKVLGVLEENSYRN